MCAGVVPQQPPTMLTRPLARELAEQLRHEFGAFVVEPELIRQASVRIRADQRIGDAPELRDVRAHFLGAERAVEPDRERRRVADRIPECRRRLTGQQPPRHVRDRAGDHDRHAHAARFGLVEDGVDRGLGVERVEDRLDQEEVRAAVEQAAYLLGIGIAQLVERDGAEAGIGDIGRDRRRAVGRADRACDEALAPVLVLGGQRGGAHQPRTLEVELVGDVLHAVVGLRDRRRGERVGRDDVGAGAEIGEMDVAHRLRLAQIQQIVVAAHLAVPGIEARAAIAGLVQFVFLDHRAHRAVEHEDALGRLFAQGLINTHQAASFTAGRNPSK